MHITKECDFLSMCYGLTSHGYDIRAKHGVLNPGIFNSFSSHGYDIRAKQYIYEDSIDTCFSSHGYDIRAKQSIHNR